MRLKQEVRVRQKQAYVWAGLGVSLVLAFSIFITLNIGSVEDSKAEITTENTWTGKKNNSFNESKNWSKGVVPNRNTKVIIDSLSLGEIEIGKREETVVGELEIKGGNKLKVLGNLQVEKDVLIHSNGSEISIYGELSVGGSIFVLNKGNIVFSKGAIGQIDYDLVVENAAANNAGALNIERNVELRRFDSEYLQEGGSLIIKQNLKLMASGAAQNLFHINGGFSQIFGAVSFSKSTVGFNTIGKLKVSKGSLYLNEVVRNTQESFDLPTNFNLEVRGGEIVFKNDLNFDTLTLENLTVKYGEGVKTWENDKQYSRSETNDVVAVKYLGKVYWLNQSKWKSIGSLPESNNSDWIYIGKVGTLDESCKCANIDEWSNTKSYEREGANEEIFIQYKGNIYRMNKSALLTKGNEPDRNAWAWQKWYSCPTSTEFFYDKLLVKGGKVVFERAWNHRPGVEFESGSELVIKEGNTLLSFYEGDILEDISIEKDASLNAKGAIRVRGNLINNSSNVIGSTGTLILSGTGNQQLKGGLDLIIKKLVIAKDSGEIEVLKSVEIIDSLVWESPIPLFLSKSFKKQQIAISFLDSANYSGSGWIDGTVRKVGNTEFIYPVGSHYKAGPIELSNPNEQSAYSVTYKVGSPPNLNSLSSSVQTISALEYWEVDVEYGNENVIPTVYWLNAKWSCIESPKDLVIAGFSGSKWTSLGNRFYKDKNDLGSVTAKSSIKDTRFFTFGSNSVLNPLNTTGAPFTATKTKTGIEISWSQLPQTAYKIEVYGNDSSSGLNYLKSVKVGAANGSQNIDVFLAQNMEYDFSVKILEGDKVWHSNVKKDNFSNLDKSVSVYPNPYSDYFFVEFNAQKEGTGFITLLNMAGQELYRKDIAITQGVNRIKYTDEVNLKNGQYLVSIQLRNEKWSKLISKK